MSSPAAKNATPAGRIASFEPRVAEAFGKVVRSLREQRGVAQDAFALVAKVDRSYFGKLERGERQPSLALLLRIATALEVPGALLVELSEAAMKADRGDGSSK